MLKISASGFNSSVYLLTRFVSGIVGYGLRRAWVRYVATCVAASSEGILGKGRIFGKNYIVLKTFYVAVLGM